MSTLPEPQLAAPSVDEPPVAVEGPLTWRSLILGFLLVAFVSILTPYSDYIRSNTYLIGNHLPLIVVMVITFLAVIVNPLLGRRRLRNSEMAVAIGMMLVSCAFPSSGFFRYFHNLLVMLVNNISVTPANKDYVGSLPGNLFPSLDPNNPAITGFLNGINPRRGETLFDTWGPWITPMLSWAMFYLPLFGALVLFAVIMRKQWVVHERLAFPLAAIPMEMLAPPEEGRRLNALFRNRALWIAALIPFLLHLHNGIAKYQASNMGIPLSFDLSKSFSEFPWNQLNFGIVTPHIYFSVIGVTFFVPLEIAFSMWFCFIAYSFAIVYFRGIGIDVNEEHECYQGIGMYLVYAGMLLVIARHHFWHIFKNFLKPREPDEFLPYWASVGGFGLCLLLTVAFLAVHGVTWWLALVAMIGVILWCMVLSRIVMEAGVLFVQFPSGNALYGALGYFFQGYTSALTKLEAIRDWMMLSIATRMGYTDQRENLMPFAANALRLGSEVQPRFRVRYLAMLFLAIFGALTISGTTHHLLSYNYGRRSGFHEEWSTNTLPPEVVKGAQNWAEPGVVPVKINRGLNITGGGITMALVSLGRLMWSNFPLHPIGLLTNNSYPVRMMWFSIFLAWAAKLVILRWGGAKVFNQARPFFIGLIVGEALASVMWMIFGLFVDWPSGTYNFLPT